MALKPDEGASRRGWHYYDQWRECPRLFYFRRVLGLEATQKRAALVKGKALHQCQESFLEGSDEALTQSDLGEYLAQERDAFFEPVDLAEARDDIWRAFVAWRRALGEDDLRRYKLIGNEIAVDAELAPGIIVTARLDSLYEEPDTGTLFIRDTKTSSSAKAESICLNTQLDDQLVLYTALVRERFDGRHPYVLIDGVAFRKKDPGISRATCFFSSDTLADTVEGLVSDIRDIQSRVAFVRAQPYEWRSAFPRHCLKCRLWGCVYADLCRVGISASQQGEHLPGFKWVDTDADSEEDVED